VNRDVDVAGTGRLGWLRLQLLAALGVLVSLLGSMAIALSLEPFLLAMAAPFVIALLLRVRWPRLGAILLGVFSLAALLFSVPFLVEALIHPESLADFIPLVIFTVSLLVGTVAAVPSFRQGRGPSGASGLPRTIAVGAGALIVAASVLSVLAFVGIDDVPAQTGDIRVVTEDIEFHPAEIDAEGGTVSVHITNRDSTRHTFTIDALGVDLNVPPNSTQRVSFAARPGTYRFYCRPHGPGMEGELVVR
jgi:plastocyanin